MIAKVLDVLAGDLRLSQPVESEQGDQGVLSRGEHRGHQEGAELIGVRAVACDS